MEGILQVAEPAQQRIIDITPSSQSTNFRSTGVHTIDIYSLFLIMWFIQPAHENGIMEFQNSNCRVVR